MPDGGEGLDEVGGGVGAGVAFGDGAELGVGAEDEIDAGAGPFYFSGGAVAAFGEFGRLSGLPLGFYAQLQPYEDNYSSVLLTMLSGTIVIPQGEVDMHESVESGRGPV